MKQTKQLSRSRWLLLTLLSLLMTLGGTSPAWAETKTVNDKTNTNQYLPIFGQYADEVNTVSEFIIPADRLEDLAGSSLSGMTFYLSTPVSGAWGSDVFEVYMKEVTATSYASVATNTEGTNNIVYTGTLDGSQSTMVVTFSNSYNYNGGNLLIGFKVTTGGTYKNTYFYGESFDYGTYNALRYAGSNSNQRDRQSFLPKVTFTYTPDPNHISKPSGAEATNVAATTATVSWAEADGVTWEYTYKTTDEEPEEAGSYTSTDTRTVNLTNLSDNTTYYFFVRAIKNTSHSAWTKVTFKTLQNAVDLTTGSFADDFESGNNWAFVNGNLTNAWAIGSATSNGGTKSMYISNNGGTSNEYTVTSATMVYATKLFTLAAGKYDISYDWKANGESNYDYMRVAIVPASTTLTAGTSVPTGFSSSALPTGWIAIDGGSKLNLKNDWQTQAAEATITEAGNYVVAFAWRNDNSTGTQPAAAIDNFSIAFQACPKPTNVEYTGLAANEVTLNWNTVEETTWEVYISTESAKPAANQEPTASPTENTYQFTGLTTETHYYAWVRAVKAAGKSDWVGIDFTTPAAVPVIALSTTSHNFGMVSNADTQALTLTISNEGGAALNGLTVTPTSGFAVTDMEGNALATTTIAAGSSLNVKVKMNAVGQQNGTVTIDGTEIDAQEVTVSGYMLDNTKIAETFTSAVPAYWTEYAYKSGYSTYNWSYSADGAYNTNENSTLSTPKITVAESETLTIYAKLKTSANYGYLTVEGSADNGETWTAYTKKLDYEAFSNTTNIFQLITLNDIPTTVNKLRFKCYYAYLNAINGFTYAPDPVLALYSDEECTAAQAATAAKNFGFVTETQQQKYYIKNTGTGQIDLTIEQADGFTATVDDAALTEGEKATLTISMAATEGLHDGTLTVTAKNNDTDEELGTFEVALNGAAVGSKNDVNFASLSDVPAGWDKGSWTVTANSYVQNNSGTTNEMTTATFTVTAGETLLVEAQGSSSWNEPTLTYSYKAGEADWTEAASIGTVTYNNWKVYAITGIPAGEAKVKFSGTYIRIRRVYGFSAKAEPFMVFAADGTTKNFGMVTANTISDAYTISNTGTATLENLSVTCDNENFEIAVAENATSIAAEGSATFTVTLKNTTLGSQTGSVTISGTGVESKTLNVKGYVADGTKIFETFASLPSHWTNSGWTFDANGATVTNNSSKLESPKIVVVEGQKLAISIKQRYSGSSYYVTINGSSDNGATWTAYTKTLNNTQLNNTDYTVVELDDIPTTVNKLQLVGYYVYVNGLNGFTYDENDPKFSMFSDSECESAIAETTATNAWGFVSEDKSATYYIKNTGTGTMTLAASAAPAGFTATLGKTSLAANESTSLVISMANDAENNEGYHAGDVVLTAKDNAENTLGTFTVTSSGVVVGSKTDINFTTLSDVPAGWEKGNWTVTANTKVAVGSTSSSLITGTYTVADGESMVIKAKKQYNYGTLTYSYSTDNGENWSNAQTITPNSTSYELIAISGIPAGTAKIKFTGTYIDIERIYGYTAVLEPAMSLEPAAASYDFGMQTTAANYEITVTNSGTATMTNLTASLETGSDYEVALSIPNGSTATISEGKANVPVGQSAIITVTQKFDAAKGLASLSDVLTISADDVASKAITLSGKTRDASKWYVDFTSGIPTELTNSGWAVYNNQYVYASSSESTLTTKTLTVAAGEKLQFDAKLWQSSGYLKVRYSVNGGISWSEYTTYDNNNLTTSNWTSIDMNMQNASETVAIVELKGYNIYLDNLYGGVLNNEAPMISITKSGNAVENGATEDFGSITAEQTATYTITNVGNGTLTITSPLTVTGVATASVNETSLTSGQSATLTITMPAEYPYGTKDGVVTVVTNLGNFVINYTATILNPNALDEQFASGKPAGWYFGGYWEVSSQQAQNSASGVADLITEQLTVADESDVLTFQAAKTGNSAETFKVYTSQDRVEWNEVDLGGLTLTTSYQDVNISGLAAGDYYVKISGARVKVDNFLGWTKKNNTRDLYVTATSYPADTQNPSTENLTASVTVTSLIAAESGIYAKLFINDVETATATSADVALRGSQTFSMNYTAPATAGTYTAQIKVYDSDNNVAFTTAVQNLKVYLLLDETVAPSLSEGEYDVQLNRSFTANSWNTICLPFAVADITAIFGVNAKAFEYKGFSNNTLNFDNVTALEAGKPYLLHVTTEVGAPVAFSNVSVTETTAGNVELNGVTFQGTYAPIAAPDLQGKYGVGTDNKLHKGSANATMNGFRGYFIGELAGARISTFDETTGITNVYATEGMFGDQRVYNLNGQHVENAKKGVFIVNGKKVVVK